MSDDITRKLSTEGVISLHDLLAAVLEHIWIVAVTSMLGVFGGFYIIAKTPQQFATTTEIEVVPPKIVSNVQSANPMDPTSDVSIETMLHLLKSPQFTVRVVEKLDLTEDPAFWGVPVGTPLDHKPDQAASVLAGSISTALKQGTHLIDITVTHSNQDMCRRLANNVAAEFVEYEKDMSSSTLDTTDAMIRDEEEKTHEQLLTAQTKLQAFRESNQTVVLDSKEMENTNTRVAEANHARMTLESDLKEIELHPDDPELLLGLPSIASNPTVATLRNSIASWQEQIAKMQQRYTELHPKLIRGRQELASIKEALYRAALDAKDTVRPRYEAAYAEEKALQDQALNLNKLAIEYENMVSDVENSNNAYNQVLKRKNEIALNKAEKAPQIAIRQAADYPMAPISPNKKRIWTMAIGSGLSSGLMIAFVFYFLDSSVKRVEKAESLFKLPVLTVIPESQKKDAFEKGGAAHPDDIEATVKESFRSLIVALNLLGGPPGCKVCLFTSSIPDEGKSFCSFHCATHLASQGKKTLLIDTDLRRPSLHRFMNASEDQKGTADFLSGQADFLDIVNPTAYENLFYLPSGSRSPNPIKLLSDGNFRKVLDIAMPTYDYIVLDTAPINAVADTLLLAEYAHHLCLIIRTGKTPIHAIRRSLQSLGNARKEPSGIIMNRFIARRGAYYYYSYSYNKSYGPDEVYGRDNKKKKS
jgi:capsular exopolysaccharide synthesis family protein